MLLQYTNTDFRESVVAQWAQGRQERPAVTLPTGVTCWHCYVRKNNWFVLFL